MLHGDFIAKTTLWATKSYLTYEIHRKEGFINLVYLHTSIPPAMNRSLITKCVRSHRSIHHMTSSKLFIERGNNSSAILCRLKRPNDLRPSGRASFSAIPDLDDDSHEWPKSKANYGINKCPQGFSMIIERNGEHINHNNMAITCTSYFTLYHHMSLGLILSYFQVVSLISF